MRAECVEARHVIYHAHNFISQDEAMTYSRVLVFDVVRFDLKGYD